MTKFSRTKRARESRSLENFKINRTGNQSIYSARINDGRFFFFFFVLVKDFNVCGLIETTLPSQQHGRLLVFLRWRDNYISEFTQWIDTAQSLSQGELPLHSSFSLPPPPPPSLSLSFSLARSLARSYSFLFFPLFLPFPPFSSLLLFPLVSIELFQLLRSSNYCFSPTSYNSVCLANCRIFRFANHYSVTVTYFLEEIASTKQL